MRTVIPTRSAIWHACLSAALALFVLSAAASSSQSEPEVIDRIAQLRAALAPGVAAEKSSGYAAFAAWNSAPEEAVTDEWRNLVLQAIADPRTRPSFWYLAIPVVRTRFPALRAVDRERALSDTLAFCDAVETQVSDLGPTQRLILQYCRARALRGSGRLLASLELFEALDATECKVAGAPSYVDGEYGLARNAVREGYVAILIEAGLTRDAFRLARDKSRSISAALLAEVELRRDRPEAALKALAGAIPAHDRARARLLEGIAQARIGHGVEARRILGSILGRPSPDSVEGAATDLEFGPVELTRAAINLAEFESSIGNQAAVASLLEDKAWASGNTELLDARRAALAADWATKTEQSLEEIERSRATMRTAFARWLEVWRKLDPVPGGARFLQAPHRRELLASVIRTELDEEDGVPRAFQTLLDAQSCGTLSKRLGLARATLENVSSFVQQSGGGLIAVLPLLEQTHVFAVDASGIHHVSAPALGSSETSRRLDALMRSQDRTGDERALLVSLAEQFTTDLLPGDLRRRVEAWETVRFAGLDRATSWPPALMRTTDGGWLGCQTRVTEWPSIPVGLELESRPAHQAKPWHAVLGPLVEGRDDVAPLPFTATEEATLRRLLGEGGAITLGKRASLPELSGPALGLLYLHCHGELHHLDRRPGRLLLASGAVTAQDIETWASGKRGPEGVLLAACSAGRSQSELGEDGSDSLGSAFFFSGTRWVAAPRHRIFDQPARRFALEFLAALRTGVPTGEACRLARIQLMRRGADPRDAAGLRLIGAGD